MNLIKKDNTKVNAGKLRCRVIIQIIQKVPDGYGSFIETWTDQDTVYAAIIPLRGVELLAAQKEQSEITTKIIIRYRSKFLADYRFKYGNRYFYVETIINPEERNRSLELMCRETK